MCWCVNNFREVANIGRNFKNDFYRFDFVREVFLFVKKREDFFRLCARNPLDLQKVFHPRRFDRLGRPEMVEERFFARRTDARNFIERVFGNIHRPAFPVRTDGKTVHLIP